MATVDRRVGRFSSAEQAEAARPEFEKAHRAHFSVVEAEDWPGEFTLGIFGPVETVSFTPEQQAAAEAATRAKRAGRNAPKYGTAQAVRTAIHVWPEEKSTKTPREDQRDRFNVQTAGDFMRRPRTGWIIKDVVPAAELMLITGAQTAGKSFFAYGMAAAIHRGVDWYGRRVRKGRVVYLLAEGAGRFGDRIEAYAIAHGVDYAELPLLIADVPDLKTAADAALIAFKVGKADAIFIDTLAASFTGNENSGEDLGPVIKHCKWLHEKTGATIVLIAHPGKDVSRGVRGWSGLIAAADAELVIERSGEHRSAHIRKMKDGVEGPLLSFKLRVIEIGRDEDGDAITSAVIEECDAAPQRPTAPQFFGANQIAIKKALDEIAPGGGVAAVGDVREAALRLTAHDPENAAEVRDRKKNLGKALNDLVKKGLVHMRGVGFVSLTSAIEVIEDDTISDIASAASLQAAIEGPSHD